MLAISYSLRSMTMALGAAGALACAGVAAAAPKASATVTGSPVGPGVCGGFPKADNGPHDYRTVRDKRLAIVEAYHFTPGVEALTRGSSSADIGGDLSFTLRAFPNHHRALMSMVRLSDRSRSEQPRGSTLIVECWLERAVRFAPDDAVARMIYANYLVKRNRSDDALVQMDKVAEVAGDSAFTHYNAGLILVEMKQYQRALDHAHKAQALGLQRTELREKLQSVGQWKDAPEAAAPAGGAASAAAASAPAVAAPAPAAAASAP